MSSPDAKREVLPGGAVRVYSGDASFEFRRPRPGALHIKIVGMDKGQFGVMPLDEITAALNRETPLELFFDARGVIGAAVSVSEEWTRFFATHRAKLSRVHVLAGSKAVQITVAIAQHLSRTGDLIRIHKDPAEFEILLAEAGRSRRP